MLQISDELRQAFLTDSTRKEIEIEFEDTAGTETPNDFSKVNFYAEYDATDTQEIQKSGGGYIGFENIFEISDNADFIQYQKDCNYAYISFTFKINSLNLPETPTGIIFSVNVIKANGVYSIFDVVSYPIETFNTMQTVELLISMPSNPTHEDDNFYLGYDDGYTSYVKCHFINANGQSITGNGSYNFGVTYQRHIQIGNDPTAFPYQNDIQVEYLGLDFDDYVQYSPKRPNKFSQINFYPSDIPVSVDSTFDLHNDCRVPGVQNQVDYLFNEYKSQAHFVKIQLKYKVTKFSLGVTDVLVAPTLHYSRTWSGTWEGGKQQLALNTEMTYSFVFSIDDYPNLRITDFSLRFCQSGSFFPSYPSGTMCDIAFTFKGTSICLGDNGVDLPYENVVRVNADNIEDYILPETDAFTLTNTDLKQESFTLTESICSSDVLKFGTTESALCDFSVANIAYDNLEGRYFKPYIKCADIDERIPLGRFRVKKVTKSGSHNIVTKRIEAYDGMYPLKMEADDWFQDYVGIIPKYYYNGYSIVARQIFSTLNSALNHIGVDCNITNISTENYYFLSCSTVIGGKWTLREFTDSEGDSYEDYIEYGMLAYTPLSGVDILVNPDKFYKININYEYRPELIQYFEDGVGRYFYTFGVYPDNGGIIITEIDNNDDVIHRFCVDDKEWFAVHENTKYIRVSIPEKYHCYIPHGDNAWVLNQYYVNYPSTNTMTISSGECEAIQPAKQSGNLALPMVYYNRDTYEVAKGTNITFRDVIRSLVEVTGSFFKYNRDGEVEFIQCARAGLYPSETLYPEEDLYPRRGLNGPLLAMSRYKSFRCDDSAINDFGKIQIIAKDLKTYVGSNKKPNAYIVNDNVFYSASVVTYVLNVDGTEPFPEVVEMMQNLYDIIQSVKYVPCEIDMVGMPWVECGDRIGLLTSRSGFESFVFKRRLKGIQSLSDEIESLGETNTEEIIEIWR